VYKRVFPHQASFFANQIRPGGIYQSITNVIVIYIIASGMNAHNPSGNTPDEYIRCYRYQELLNIGDHSKWSSKSTLW